MALARFFSKPRWQSKDEAIRRAAVANDDDAELRAALPRLAREDPDAGVRIAALKRVAEPGLAQALAHDDRDAGVRAVAVGVWTELLTGTHAASPTLVERVRLLRAQDDPRLIEYIAVRAPEPELRLAALLRVARPALIVERATADVDAGVRAAALERIDDEAQLERIAERARKSDKKTSRLASERLDALRLARGDIGAISERARVLCEALEAVLRGATNVDAGDIDRQWNVIEAYVPAGLAARYAKSKTLYQLSRDPARVAELRERTLERERVTAELAALERDANSPDALASRDTLGERFDRLAERFATSTASEAREPSAVDALRVRTIAQLLEQLAAQSVAAIARRAVATDDVELADERARRAADLAASEARGARQREKQQAAIDELTRAVESVEPLIDSGNTAGLHVAWPAIAASRKQLGDAMPAELRRRVTDIESHYARLAEWQRWSDNHRRRQLCEEIEALPAALLHPDAVATRVREAQAEWTRLDTLEGRPSQAVDSLSRRFRTVCRQAIEPTRPYFDKRDELRKAHAQHLAELIARAGTPLDGPTNGSDIANLRRETGEALRSLDAVDPRERKLLAQKLKQAIGELDARVDAQHASVESAKSALIGEASALGELADVRSAIASARELQKRWQASGSGKRSRDEAQWRAFRKAVDAVFARADGERAARTQRDIDALVQANSVCAELEGLAGADATPARAEVARLDAAWNALSVSDASLRERHQRAHSALRDAHSRRSRNERRSRFDNWLAHYRVIRRAERGDVEPTVVAAERGSLAALTVAAEAMRQRENLISNETTSNTDEIAAQRDCLLEIEQLAGIESPPEDRQRRLDLQVAKLSARLRGDPADAPTDALERLLVRWTQSGALPDSAAAWDARLETALDRVLGELG